MTCLPEHFNHQSQRPQAVTAYTKLARLVVKVEEKTTFTTDAQKEAFVPPLSLSARNSKKPLSLSWPACAPLGQLRCSS
jgi:hypothetical protein